MKTLWSALALAMVWIPLGCATPTTFVEVAPTLDTTPRTAAPDPTNDTDGDAIKNQDDACPEVPEDLDGFEDEDGCPDLDNDQDGVPDTDDLCPNEPESLNGFEDEDGCHENQHVVIIKPIEHEPMIDPIVFDAGSTVLTRPSQDILDAVAKVLSDNPEVRLLQIGGHADDPGGDGANLALGQKRAETVRNALISRGIAAERLTTTSFGNTQPIVRTQGLKKEDLKVARTRNRRIEFKILKKD